MTAIQLHLTTDQAHIDYINDTGNTSKNNKDYLLGNYPVSDYDLNAAINMGTIMTSGDWWWVLDGYSPLTEGVLSTLVNKEGIMTSLNYKDILIQNSPLPASIVDQVTAGSPTTLSSSHQQQVLNAQQLLR